MSQAHLDAFKADVEAIKSGSRLFYRPTVNYGDRFGRDSSVANLVTHLSGALAGPSMGLVEAVAFADNPDDTRLKKYMPAIERLVRVWGTAAHYPAISAPDSDRDTALFNFVRASRRLAAPSRPLWRTLKIRRPDSQFTASHSAWLLGLDTLTEFTWTAEMWILRQGACCWRLVSPPNRRTTRAVTSRTSGLASRISGG